MKWSILAGIGQVESGHGLFYGGEVDDSGTVSPPIIGVALNGGVINDRGDRVQAIPDTDDGRYDRDTTWDRAVGPMQFIPGTWLAWAPDATGVEAPDPQNIFYAARAAVAYLCGEGATDLTDSETLERRIRAYNNSGRYVADVLDNIAEYDAIPVGSPAAAGSVQEVGAQTPCANLGQMHPDACTMHDHLNEVFGGWYVSAGGWRDEPTSDHGHGQAIDYMLAADGDMPTPQMSAQGIVVVDYLTANAEQFNVKGLIYQQRIWNPNKQSVGPWQEVSLPMDDRGSITENHFDHVHVSVGPPPFR
ncbi:hypothetical protein ACFXKD_00030 [Nocardiopsis aegyptia]|uniref:hypothetical protein n=1 Tax=Nocardiopsis aegyptia TaxID=220378 RepID=UPI003670049E